MRPPCLPTSKHHNAIYIHSFPFHFSSFRHFLPRISSLRDIKQRLHLLDQKPLIVRHLLPVELLEGVDASAGDETVQGVLLLEVAAVGGLAAAHFDLDGNGGLALFADGDLLVVTFNGGAGGLVSGMLLW